MRGVILAGGTGSRLRPLTNVTNKHLLPVGRYPMIYYPIRALIDADIRDILVVTGKEHMGSVVNLLGSGHTWGVRFTYRVQDEAGGIAQALGLAEDFARTDRMVVVLGDNVFSHSIAAYVAAFAQQREGARVLLKEVANPSRYGVPVFEGDRIVRIEEKPKEPKSSYCVTGIYMYEPDVFDVIAGLKPSARGELEITDVNNHYIERGTLAWDILPGWWTDAGTFESLAVANHLAEAVTEMGDSGWKELLPGILHSQ
jgi:glucose-1-phosphate thymidylyltransferase